MSRFDEDMEATAWRSLFRRPHASNPDVLAGVAAERRRCIQLVLSSTAGASPERRQLVADLIRAIEGTT